jgi:uracil-DNA glycosylase
MPCNAIGPANARIMVVGDHPGKDDIEAGELFTDTAGKELKKMLQDAKVNPGEVFFTNLCMERPPKIPKGDPIDAWIHPKKSCPILVDHAGKPVLNEKDKKQPDPSFVQFRGKWVKDFIPSWHSRLLDEIRRVQPKVVLALSNTALWALTTKSGIKKWRGSTLTSDCVPGLKIIPTYHPVSVLRQMDNRFITVQDFRRAARESHYPEIRPPGWQFITNPSVETIFEIIGDLRQLVEAGPLKLVCDLEIKRNEILCLGIAWSSKNAICIPFYDGVDPANPKLGGKFRFDPATHVAIVDALRNLFQHPNCRFCNQNVSFDIQYLFWRFGIWPRAVWDTMIAQNVLFAGAPKSLDYLASMFCAHYVYWKDDGKFWDKPVEYPQMWTYNCEDCVRTFEVWEQQELAINALKLEQQMRFEMDLFHPVMQMMLRGVQVNVNQKREITRQLINTVETFKQEANYLACRNLLGKAGGFSNTKLQKLFYTDLGLPKQYNRGGGEVKITTDDEALKKLARKEPLVKPLCDRINLSRSYATAVSAVTSGVDKDGRWRTAYNIAGTNSYRFSSSENPFGSGLNLQNLTSGKDILKEL